MPSHPLPNLAPAPQRQRLEPEEDGREKIRAAVLALDRGKNKGLVRRAALINALRRDFSFVVHTLDQAIADGVLEQLVDERGRLMVRLPRQLTMF